MSHLLDSTCKMVKESLRSRIDLVQRVDEAGDPPAHERRNHATTATFEASTLCSVNASSVNNILQYTNQIVVEGEVVSAGENSSSVCRHTGAWAGKTVYLPPGTKRESAKR